MRNAFDSAVKRARGLCESLLDDESYRKYASSRNSSKYGSDRLFSMNANVKTNETENLRLAVNKLFEKYRNLYWFFNDPGDGTVKRSIDVGLARLKGVSEADIDDINKKMSYVFTVIQEINW